MTIAYTSVTLSTASITLRGVTYLDILLSGAATGTVYGAVTVNDRTFDIELRAGLTYRCMIRGGLAGRMTAETIYVVMGDDDGPVKDATALTLTVTDVTEPFIVRPEVWVKETLEDNWDTTFISLPLIIYPWDRKAKTGLELKRLVEIVPKKVETKVRGRGDYKDNKYPIEIIVRSEGEEDSRNIARKLMAETKRLIETNWNDIAYLGLDDVEFTEDDGEDLSPKMAGKHEWRWNFKIGGHLRGRAGTPADPTP